MNKFQRAGLAVVAASGMAFAGAPLWGPDTQDFPSLQVNVPDKLDCWAEFPTPSEENPCYDLTAGWWYGYQYSDGDAQLKKEGEYVAFGVGVSITEGSLGGSLIDPDALRVKLTAKSKTGAGDYGGAGIGFDFGKPKGNTANISGCEGYVITYSSDGALQFKLGYDESTYDDGCSWDAALPAKATPTRVELRWDDFIQPTWCATASRPKPKITKADALSKAEAAKIATPASESTSATTVELALYGLEWISNNENCAIGGGPSPIIAGGKGAVNPVSFDIAGKMLSMNSSVGSLSIQIINLHGTIVQSKTMNNAEKMNLYNLPSGVYMVRVPSLGYIHKFTIR